MRFGFFSVLLLFVLLCLSAAPSFAIDILIDDFNGPKLVEAIPAELSNPAHSGYVYNGENGSGPIGGYRGYSIFVLLGDRIKVSTSTMEGQHFLRHVASPFSAGSSQIIWDGNPTPTRFNPQGLGSIDLGDGPHRAFSILVSKYVPHDGEKVTLIMTVYDTDDPTGQTTAEGKVTLEREIRNELVNIPFDEMKPGLTNKKANFSRVGALSLGIDGGKSTGTDIILSSIKVTEATERIVPLVKDATPLQVPPPAIDTQSTIAPANTPLTREIEQPTLPVANPTDTPKPEPTSIEPTATSAATSSPTKSAPTARATVTSTATRTATQSPSSTPEDTPTKLPSATLTPKPSATATPLPPTATPMPSPSHTKTALPTRESTATKSPTPTRTATPTRTETATRSPSPTRTPTKTPTLRPTGTTTGTPTATRTPVPTRTATPTRTPTKTPLLLPTKTATPELATYGKCIRDFSGTLRCVQFPGVGLSSCKVSSDCLPQTPRPEATHAVSESTPTPMSQAEYACHCACRIAGEETFSCSRPWQIDKKTDEAFCPDAREGIFPQSFYRQVGFKFKPSDTQYCVRWNGRAASGYPGPQVAEGGVPCVLEGCELFGARGEKIAPTTEAKDAPPTVEEKPAQKKSKGKK